MRTGWVEENGQRKYLDSTGILRTGWLSDGGQDYYMLSDGSPASGWQNIEGKIYYLQESTDEGYQGALWKSDGSGAQSRWYV